MSVSRVVGVGEKNKMKKREDFSVLEIWFFLLIVFLWVRFPKILTRFKRRKNVGRPLWPFITSSDSQIYGRFGINELNITPVPLNRLEFEAYALN